MELKFIYPVLLIILSGLLFFGLGEQVVYAKSGVARLITFILLFVGIPFSIYKTIRSISNKKTASKFAALSVLILGTGFGFWSKYQSENDLRKYGKVTYGTVIKRERTSVNNRGRWTITAEFEYHSKVFTTFSQDDNDNRFQLKDKIRIRFSTRNPENNEILDLK